MLNIIAIEGIDRIGKSTFINDLQQALEQQYYDEVRIEKPSIGLNTSRHNSDYPLLGIPGIMEIRNIGLFEELLFQCQHRQNDKDEYIIRDRFNLSELAYGDTLRPSQFGRIFNQIGGVSLYKEWNRWFEQQLETVANVFMVTFVLDEQSYPNEDEVVSSSDLVNVNETFKIIYDECSFNNKILIRLHRSDDGLTDIMTYLPQVINWVTSNSSILSIESLMAASSIDENNVPEVFVHTLSYTPDVIINVNGAIHLIGSLDYRDDSVKLYNGTRIPSKTLNFIVKQKSDEFNNIVMKYTDSIQTRLDIVQYITSTYKELVI